MENLKTEVITLIKNLKDECDYQDILTAIYFKQQIDQRLKKISEKKEPVYQEINGKLFYKNK